MRSVGNLAGQLSADGQLEPAAELYACQAALLEERLYGNLSSDVVHYTAKRPGIFRQRQEVEVAKQSSSV